MSYLFVQHLPGPSLSLGRDGGQMDEPEWAGLAMALSSVTVVSLSLLLRRYVPPAKLAEGKRGAGDNDGDRRTTSPTPRPTS